MLIVTKWTTIRDKWTKLDLSNPTSSTCGFRNGGQNRFSICPPFTYIYLRKCKSGQKWTLFSYILFFFLFFLLYPYLPAIMLLPLFYKTPRFISDYAFFSIFAPLFTLFCTFSHPFRYHLIPVKTKPNLPHINHTKTKSTLPRGRADTPDPRLFLFYFFSFLF